uniref:hypothetical protein n=1 Tax=Paenisporosarcina sp. TG-14 TaxID=1231057 RepID=UPI001ED9861F
AILVDVLLFSFQGSLLCRLFWRLLYLNKFSMSCQQKVFAFLFQRRYQIGDFDILPPHKHQCQYLS